MPVYIFDGVNYPVVNYKFEEAAPKATSEKALAALACGFFATPCTQEMLDHPEIGFTPEEKVALMPHLGRGMIWMEESSPQYYKPNELKAVLAHEEAHLIHGDLIGATGIIENLEMEIKADKYAAQKVDAKSMNRALRKCIHLAHARIQGSGVTVVKNAIHTLETDEAISLRLSLLK